MKTVIITGASQGIGKELAITFSNNGYNVLAVYNNSKNEAEALKKYKNIDIFKADVTNQCEVDALFSYALKKYKKIDILINNAGVALKQKPLLDVSELEFNSVFNVNVKGVFLCTKNAVNAMLDGGGKIINVSSIFGIIGGSCEVVYSASKSAVIGFTRALSEELAYSNIFVASVSLGLVDTNMNAHLSSEDKLNFVKEYGLTSVPTASEVALKIYDICNLNGSELNGKNFKVFTGDIKTE
ncbi:MAG: SDR family NAD(P)-dependent oxidoreductase [Clostridia bacterium]|nr:SDR family NAD(P)-dependent oxidoreductase [Clostridia bacterium]